MTGASHIPVDWTDVARAVPGGVGIQAGETLVYVSPEFAAIVGREPEALTGEEWRTLVGSVAAERTVDDGLETVDTSGYWTGGLRFGQGTTRQEVDVTLSAFPGDEDFVLWAISERNSQPTETSVDDAPTQSQRELPHVSLTLARTVFDSIDDVVYVINEDGRFSYWNDQLVETTGYSHEEIQTMHPSEFIPRDQHEFVPGLLDAIEDIRDRRVEVDLLTKDGERITHEFSGTTFEEPGTDQVYRCGIARDITERLEHKREIARQRDKLATVNRINDLLFETARELIETGNRAAVEEAVCDQLVASELYDAVWIGERELDGDGLVTRVSAGVDSSFAPDALEEESQTDTSIVSRALETGALEVANSGDPAVAEWETATGRSGVASLIAIPLQHGETVYGVLVITTSRQNAFGPQEQAGFEVFGRLIGVVVHAARSRELLFADTVVELEFGFSESATPLADLATALNCQLSLDGYVPSQEGWVMYLTVENAPPETVATELSKDDRIDHARCISGENNTGRIEVYVSAPSILQVVSDAGATVQRASITPETARFVVETPIDTDVRWLVERITDAFPTATLLASRKCDREITTVGRPGGLLDDLTARQREVLEAAHQAGYFSWPRESTAEEVADSLGLSSATLHGHLRKAERVILSGLLDE